MPHPLKNNMRDFFGFGGSLPPSTSGFQPTFDMLFVLGNKRTREGALVAEGSVDLTKLNFGGVSDVNGEFSDSNGGGDGGVVEWEDFLIFLGGGGVRKKLEEKKKKKKETLTSPGFLLSKLSSVVHTLNLNFTSISCFPADNPLYALLSLFAAVIQSSVASTAFNPKCNRQV